MWIEGRDFFLIRCARVLPPTPGGQFRAPQFIHYWDFATIVPCWACGGKLLHSHSASPRPESDHFAVCIGCGRYWFIQAGGNPETIVLKVSIPKPDTGLHWSWDWRRDTTEEAWERYAGVIGKLGEEPLPFEQWRDKP
jgi:hypothetical protein